MSLSRRAFFILPIATAIATAEDHTTKTAVAKHANEYVESLNSWIAYFNVLGKDKIDAAECALFEDTSRNRRKLEESHYKWIRGY